MSEWLGQASCRKAPQAVREAFTADRTTPGQRAAAEALCAACAVRQPCRELLATCDAPVGLWAGRWHGPAAARPAA